MTKVTVVFLGDRKPTSMWRRARSDHGQIMNKNIQDFCKPMATDLHNIQFIWYGLVKLVHFTASYHIWQESNRRGWTHVQDMHGLVS